METEKKKPVAAASAPAPSALARAKVLYDQLFPVGSERRKLGPVIVAAPVLIVLLLAKCAVSSVGDKISAVSQARAATERVRTTGVLIVKSNLAAADIEASRIADAGEPSTARAQGPLGQALGNLTPGKYAVTARAAGWPDAQGEIDVPAGQRTEFTVNFRGGSLRLESQPSGATAKWNGAVLGKTPLVIPLLPPGDCELSLQYPGWPAVAYQVTITENVESSGSVRLPHGRLTVDSFPAGAIVVLDGKSYKQTPLFFDPIAAGPKKLTLQSGDFPPLEVAVTVADGGDITIRPVLAQGFPVLDPAAILRDVWVVDGRRGNAPAFNSITNLNRPRNDIVRNLHRQALQTDYRTKLFRFSGQVKSFDAASGSVEFDTQSTSLAPFRIVAQLKPGAEAAASAQKGSTRAVYGRLTDVLESAWPLRLITFELSDAEILPEDPL